MQNPKKLENLGILPFKKAEQRFCIGNPEGLTSNSWKIWMNNDHVYIACRDNFIQVKVSFHLNNDCLRMAFTKESGLKMQADDRAWEEWTMPSNYLKETKILFRIFFGKEDLFLVPDNRKGKKWNQEIIYIEGPPEGWLTIISVFLTKKDNILISENNKSFRLAEFDLGNTQIIQIVAHAEKIGTLNEIKNKAVKQTIFNSGIVPDGEMCILLFGKNQDDGSRFIRLSPYK